MAVLEFIDRPGNPLFHLEHFIDGKYIKYNSNSGFVEESIRLTPQVVTFLYNFWDLLLSYLQNGNFQEDSLFAYVLLIVAFYYSL